jgi:glycosyltransferase involved in cell wall biosynthesis
MKIVIFARMPKEVYSGGRYLVWIMSEALAAMGQEVTLVVDNIPMFSKDFEEYPHNKDINICVSKDLNYESKDKVDYVYCIPGGNYDELLYHHVLKCACKSGAKIVFHNFETPNWFNKYFPNARDVSAMKKMGELCKYGCIVQSMDDVAQNYAKDFFDGYPQTTRFEVWNPVINSLVADRVNVKKENQIVAMVRMTDKHKGGKDILDIVGAFMKGWRLVCIVGNGIIDSDILNELKSKAQQYGFEIEIKYSSSDYEKFTEISKSKILLFPSYFEGYGYPPIEAQYCNTMCVAYELPVVREMSGDSICYAKYGDTEDFSKVLEQCIRNCDDYYNLRENIEEKADFYKGAKKLVDMLEANLEDNIIDEKARSIYLETVTETEIKLEEKLKRLDIQLETFNVINRDSFDWDKVGGQSWELFNHEIVEKKIVAFGDGNGLKLFLQKHPQYTIEAVYDNNSNKWGKKSSHLNVMVKNPEELWNSNVDEYVVIITIYGMYNEIEEQLRNHGVSNCFSVIKMEATRIKNFLNVK